MRVGRSFALAVLAIIGAVLLVACGQAATPTPSATATPAPTAAPGQTPQPEPTATPGQAFDAEGYFRGKTITINVGFTPGGGYDVFSRVWAQVAPTHFPGRPRFVVRNIPGAGGERIFRAVGEASPDGLTTATVHPRFVKRELLGTDVEFFDLERTKIVGAPSAAITATGFYVKKALANTWEEGLALGRPMTTGATAPGDTGGLGTTFIELLGGPIRTVYGYGGTSEIAAAFDRGEIDGTSRGNYTTAPRLYPEWIQQRSIVPLVRWGAELEDDPAFVDYLTNDLAVPVPPHIFEVMNPSQGEQTVYNVTELVNEILARMYILHEDTPEDVYRAWVDAFRRVVEDPTFIEGTAAQGLTAGYAGPEEINEQLRLGRDALQDPALRDLFQELAGED